MVGIGFCSMAIILILSVFNGIEGLVNELYGTFDAELRITIEEGKTINENAFPLGDVIAVEGISEYSRVIEESVGLRHNDEQAIATLKGVEPGFIASSGLDSMIVEGSSFLVSDDAPYAIVGLGLKYNLRLNASVYDPSQMSVYAIKRGSNLARERENALNHMPIVLSGVFSVNADLDMRYCIVPFDFAREVLDYQDEFTALELRLADDADAEEVKKEIQTILGKDYLVKTRFEQNALIYETTRNEKWVTFLILSFVLLIATFNVIGSLTMLVMDKKKDVATLMCLGATRGNIRNIFFFEGILINLFGGFFGLILGFILAGLQSAYGFVKIQAGSDNALPVEMLGGDFLAVILIVVLLGIFISWIPVYYLTRKESIKTTAISSN